jgi:hypothetical protein
VSRSFSVLSLPALGLNENLFLNLNVTSTPLHSSRRLSSELSTIALSDPLDTEAPLFVSAASSTRDIGWLKMLDSSLLSEDESSIFSKSSSPGFSTNPPESLNFPSKMLYF